MDKAFVANLPAQSRYLDFLKRLKTVANSNCFWFNYPRLAWSAANSQKIYYVEPDEIRQFHVFKIPATGGRAIDLPVS